MNTAHDRLNHCPAWRACRRHGVRGLLQLAALLALSACALAPPRLAPGAATRQDVLAALGPPAQTWRLPGGGEQLAFTTGPAGYRTRIVILGPDGRLVRIDDAMREPMLDRVEAGMTEDEVLRLIGPSVPEWTADFGVRREHVLEWRFCSEFSQVSRFDVLFDQDSRRVRSTLRWVEQCGREVCYCGH
jgi:hypothetical protein